MFGGLTPQAEDLSAGRGQPLLSRLTDGATTPQSTTPPHLPCLTRLRRRDPRGTSARVALEADNTAAVGVRDYVHSRVRDYVHMTLNALLLGPPDRLPTSGTGLAATTPAVRLTASPRPYPPESGGLVCLSLTMWPWRLVDPAVGTSRILSPGAHGLEKDAISEVV